MFKFHLEIPHDPYNPDDQWTDLLNYIDAAFRAYEGAKVTLERRPDQAFDVRVELSPMPAKDAPHGKAEARPGRARLAG